MKPPRRENPVESRQLLGFRASLSGAVLAMVPGMDTNKTPRSHAGGLTPLLRVIRGFAEASLVAVGFAVAILLIGTPLALFVRGLHEGLSWLVGLGSQTSVLVQ